jgi:hypothetical protein
MSCSPGQILRVISLKRLFHSREESSRPFPCWLFARSLVLFPASKRGHLCRRMAISCRFRLFQFVKEWVNYISGLLAWCVPGCLRSTDPVKKDMAEVRNQNRMNGLNRTKNFFSLVRKLKPSFPNRKRSKVDSFSPVLTQSIFIDKDGAGIPIGFLCFICETRDFINLFCIRRTL